MRCPNCGEDNAGTARFCSACGASLLADDTPPSEERKIVSVLFVDLVGFTARSDRPRARARAAPGPGAVDLIHELDASVRDFTGFRSWLLDGNAPVCRVAGAVDLLRSLVDQGIDHMTRDANSLTSARAALAEVEGDHERALVMFEDAADRRASFPSVLENWHALAGAGRCLLALGRPVEAAARFRDAADRSASLRAAPLVGEIDAPLERAIAKTSETAG